MRKRIITSVALVALLASTPGCFTIIGGMVGGAGEPTPPKPHSGMSGGAKGVLVGAVIDAALITAAAVSFANMDFNIGGKWGPDSD